MMSLWDALRMNMMISYQELVRTFHSLIIDNDNGIIVKSNSPEELADKLAFLLSNPKARVEMGIKGRKRIQDKFSSGMIISKTLKTYHDVVEG